MTAILKNVFENSIGISVIILIIFLLRRFIDKRYTAKWQYWVWVILTLRLLLPFDVSIPNFKAPINIQVNNPVIYHKSPENPPIQDNTTAEENIVYQPENQDEPTGQPTENEVIKNEPAMYDQNIFSFTAGLIQRSSLALGDILCFAWICGSCIILVFRIGSYMIAKITLNRSACKVNIDITEIKEKLNISNDVEIYSSYMVTTPVLTGIFNPKIIIPENSTNDVHLQLALYHELVHYKRCDIGFKLLLFVATCAYWYNPCVWLMNFLAMEDIELSCDETVCTKMNHEGKSIYGESILMFAARKKEKLLYSTSFSNDKKTLAHRIKNIFSTDIKGKGAVALCAVVIFAMLSGVLVACTGTGTKDSETENASEIGPEDENAMLLIELYEKYSSGADYQPSDFSGTYSNIFDCHYYIFKPLIWALLENGDNEIHKVYSDDSSEEYQYYINLDSYKAVADMLFDTEENINEEYIDTFDGQVCIYHPDHIDIQTRFGGDYEVLLAEDGKRTEENGDVIYSFERRHENDIIGYVDYTLSPVQLQTYPDIIEKVFNTDNPLYAIKSVKSYEAILPGEEKIIYISTAEELVQMSNDYAENGSSYFNYTYMLTNDIDMSGVDNFLPIGRNRSISADDRDITESGFCSTFDGKGYTIKNVTISNYDHSEYYDEFTGFFIKISQHGVVKNLNIENLHITSEWGCGGFAGTISGTVENCHVSGTIDGKSGIGGFVNSIVGFDNTLIKNCSADVDIYGESSIAGFAACSSYSGYENHNANFTIENCTSYGSVNSRKISTDNYNYHSNPNYIAGFVSRGTLGNFINCHVQTPISLQHTANIVGGFAADVENATFTDCTYNPDTTGNWYIIGTFNLQNSHGDYRSFEFTEAVK